MHHLTTLTALLVEQAAEALELVIEHAEQGPGCENWGKAAKNALQALRDS